MRRIGLGLLAGVTLTGCGLVDGGTITTPPAVASPTSSARTSTLPPVVECPGAGDFEEGGGIADVDGEGADGSRLTRITWGGSDLCETFTFEFATSEGAPATMVPDVRIDHLETFQVIRIHMDVDAAVLTDQLVETGLVDRLYVVRSLDGEMFVDLHLSAPAAARARVGASPALLSVDLRPGFVPMTGSAAVGERVILVSPPANTAVEPVTELTGYARTFEANVLVVVTQSGTLVTETTTTAADWSETWGEFRLELGLPPGEVAVFVGEVSPEDGALEGVTVDLTVG